MFKIVIMIVVKVMNPNGVNMRENVNVFSVRMIAGSPCQPTLV